MNEDDLRNMSPQVHDFFCDEGAPFKVTFCDCSSPVDDDDGRPVFAYMRGVPKFVAAMHGVHIMCWTDECQEKFKQYNAMTGAGHQMIDHYDPFGRWVIREVMHAAVGSALDSTYWPKWFRSLDLD